MNNLLKKHSIYIDKHGSPCHYVCHEKQCIHICFSHQHPTQGDSHDHRSAFILHAKLLTFLRKFLILFPGPLLQHLKNPVQTFPATASSLFQGSSLLSCILQQAAKLAEWIPNPANFSKTPDAAGSGPECRQSTAVQFQKLAGKYVGGFFKTFFKRLWQWLMTAGLTTKIIFGGACPFSQLTDQRSRCLQQRKFEKSLIQKAALKTMDEDIIPNAWFQRHLMC